MVLRLGLDKGLEESETTNGKGLYETQSREGSSASLAELKADHAEEEVSDGCVLGSPPEHS